MRHHIYSEDRKTVRISASDLLKTLCIDLLKYEIRNVHLSVGGFERNEHSQEIELSLVERPNHETRK